jgi:mannose-1-phosphate guanylyltransferase
MITPVLACGGSGPRLWPMSRKKNPKRSARLLGQRTMLQDTVLRLQVRGMARRLLSPMAHSGSSWPSSCKRWASHLPPF